MQSLALTVVFKGQKRIKSWSLIKCQFLMCTEHPTHTHKPPPPRYDGDQAIDLKKLVGCDIS